MEQLTVEFIENNIPKLGFGAMRLPQTDAKDPLKIDMPQFKSMIDYYFENGMNYFDTAYMYHNGASETALKEALVARYDRKSYFLADKLAVWYAKEPADLSKIFQTQLDRCGVSYFDFYLLHALSEANVALCDKLNAFDFMKKLKEDGKARFIGFSFHDTPEVLDDILTKHPEMEFVQLQINYLDWQNEVRSDDYYKIARKHNKSIIIMEPVRGGSLANFSDDIAALFKEANPDASAASWAIRYCASLEGVITTLSGMSTLDQVRDNVSYMKNMRPLDESERAVIARVVEKINEAKMIPCTACRYCDICPQKIDIAEIFSIANQYKLSGEHAAAEKKYEQIEKSRRADNCIDCKQCEQVCPQKIEITENLKKMAEKF